MEEERFKELEHRLRCCPRCGVYIPLGPEPKAEHKPDCPFKDWGKEDRKATSWFVPAG